jgi:hypothetical protein
MNKQKQAEYGEILLKDFRFSEKLDALSMFKRMFNALLKNKNNGNTYEASMRHLKMREYILMLISNKKCGLCMKEKLSISERTTPVSAYT